MNKNEALHNFWSSFGIPAYDENTVPDDAPLPRLTYSVSVSEFDDPVSNSASIWYRTRSWEAITLKAEEIYDTIGLGGLIVNYDGGKIWIKRGSPFYQRMSDEDDTIRRIYINIETEFFNNK